MTHITVDIKERILRVTIKGHTGYAKKGEDIVCAGISPLAFAAGIALKRYNIPAEINPNEKEAVFVIAPKWSKLENDQLIRAETILNTLFWALEDMANSYQEYVKLDIVRRC